MCDCIARAYIRSECFARFKRETKRGAFRRLIIHPFFIFSYDVSFSFFFFVFFFFLLHNNETFGPFILGVRRDNSFTN